jgi:S1-C subfamily serine protease
VTPSHHRDAWSWWLVPAALGVAALFLALGVWQGARMVAARVAAQAHTVQLFDEAAARDALRQQTEQNAALERDIEERRRLLGGDVCVADPAQLPRLGPDRAAVPPPAALPPPPGAAPFQGNLADLLKQALVMILVPTGNGTSLGSGFFVAPDLIATNRHVVEGAGEAGIFVINEKLGRATKVDKVASSPSAEIGGLDVALLRLAGGPAVQPLALTPTVAQLDQVIAAGYPGLTIGGDAATQRLLEGGDMTAAPTLILTDGRINAIQDGPAGLKIMPHSAAISGGNSGGPLVDSCGRVVGVNTFITTDQQQTAHVNYAQKADQVIAFLRGAGAAVTEVSGPCAPPGAAGAATPGQAAPPPAPTMPPPAPAALTR